MGKEEGYLEHMTKICKYHFKLLPHLPKRIMFPKPVLLTFHDIGNSRNISFKLEKEVCVGYSNDRRVIVGSYHKMQSSAPLLIFFLLSNFYVLFWAQGRMGPNLNVILSESPQKSLKDQLRIARLSNN